MNLALILLLFGAGACIGSFVNVIALRYNTGLSFIKGSSVCLACGKDLGWRELIPVYSFLVQKARCLGCGTKFSIQYLIVEIVSGLVAIQLAYFYYPNILLALIIFLIFQVLMLIMVYDLRHKIIPDEFILAFIALAIIFASLDNQILHNTLAAILVPIPFALIWLFSKGTLMGLGDSKFMIGMGFLLGVEKSISAIFISFWAGALIVGIYYLLNSLPQFKLIQSGKKLTMKTEIPFAPFLVIGTIIVFFFQINLLNVGL